MSLLTPTPHIDSSFFETIRFNPRGSLFVYVLFDIDIEPISDDVLISRGDDFEKRKETGKAGTASY